ncbi:MAG TPA: type IV toxin-antitoxin system AbiEi family antitoxin domain-containing protein [Thermoleophilaceae bacterium]|jgi:very-short-patch-repair endonuclease|nr:type IV toxin-antitoxin system AbiEi family antitoxin domain-containing protein [Thermoleophilaceae bacterium]
MDAQEPKPTLQQLIAELARRQHGVVARWQLVKLGLGRGAIGARLRSGRWRRIHRGVYATGDAPLSREGRFIAAVLACGEAAVLSHRSAAVMWGILSGGPAWAEVTVPGDRGRELVGVKVHRQRLNAADVTSRNAIPITTPGRTLIDLAEVVSERTLERAMDEAEYLRLDCTGLKPIPGRAGSGRLARVLSLHRPGATRTRTPLEERFLDLCRRAQLPQPEVNVHVEGYEVDFLWRARRLVIETDGHAAHRTRRAFERDPVRDADLIEAGYRPIRITARRLAREPEAIAAQLHRLLAS